MGSEAGVQKALRDVAAYQDRGRTMWESRDFHSAVDNYRQGLWEYPDSITLQLGLAYSYFYLKEFVNAVRSFEIVLRFQPANKRAVRGLGLCYLKLNRVEDAQRNFRQLQGDCELPPAELMEIAYYFFQVQDYVEALNFAERVLEADPEYTDGYICTAGCLHFLKREPARKLALFQRALEIEPARLDLVDFYANVLFDDMYLPEALAMYERLPLQDMQNPISLRRLIELYDYYKVDESMMERYRERLNHIERGASVDGLVDSIMNFLENE